MSFYSTKKGEASWACPQLCAPATCLSCGDPGGILHTVVLYNRDIFWLQATHHIYHITAPLIRKTKKITNNSKGLWYLQGFL